MIQGEFRYQILFTGEVYFVYFHRNDEGKVVAEHGEVVSYEMFLEIVRRVRVKAKEFTEGIDMSSSPFAEAVPEDINERLNKKDNGLQPA